MAKIEKHDPEPLLGQAVDENKGRLVNHIVKSLGFEDANDLNAHGSTADKDKLTKAQKVEDNTILHRDELSTWLNMINMLVDEVEAIKGRLDKLEKKV